MLSGPIRQVGDSLYVIVDDQLGKYLRYLYKWNYGTQLTAPSRGMHITLDSDIQGDVLYPKDDVRFIIKDFDENDKVVWANIQFVDPVPSQRQSFHFAVGYKRA